MGAKDCCLKGYSKKMGGAIELGYDVYKLEDEVWKVYELALMSWLPHLAAVAEVSKKRGHVLSYLTMGWSKQDRDDIPEEDMPPQRRFVLTAPPPGCDVAESSTTATARVPSGQYDFVDAVEARQGLIRSPGHDTRTIARAADKAEDVSYVRAL
ncbi:hypothetical protein Tco_0238140 [Tanacetum coccineum]